MIEIKEETPMSLVGFIQGWRQEEAWPSPINMLANAPLPHQQAHSLEHTCLYA